MPLTILSEAQAEIAYARIAAHAGVHSYNNKRKTFRTYKWSGMSPSKPALKQILDSLASEGIEVVRNEGNLRHYVLPSITIRVPIDCVPCVAKEATDRARISRITDCIDEVRQDAVNALAKYAGMFFVQQRYNGRDAEISIDFTDVRVIADSLSPDALSLTQTVVKRLLSKK